MVAPLTETICRTVAQPCPPQTCPTTGATILTSAPFALLPNVETPVNFGLDVWESPPGGPTDADSANDRIGIGLDGTYLVQLSASYSPGFGTVTVRILVDGVSNPELTFVHTLDAFVISTHIEEVAVSLSASQELTVTLETTAPEGLLVGGVSLTAVNSCGPFEEVIVPQG